MPRRPAAVSQADVARTIRAARQTGASVVEVVQQDGTMIRVLLTAPTLSPTANDPFDQWKQENEARKAARSRNRH
jgi:hypothetical protein